MTEPKDLIFLGPRSYLHLCRKPLLPEFNLTENRRKRSEQRVLKVKRMFRVSYKTVVYRLVETGRAMSGRSFSGNTRSVLERL